jgi:hypothetical protein
VLGIFFVFSLAVTVHCSKKAQNFSKKKHGLSRTWGQEQMRFRGFGLGAPVSLAGESGHGALQLIPQKGTEFFKKKTWVIPGVGPNGAKWGQSRI